MIIKPREKSVSHFILESLYFRGELAEQDLRNYENQVKGFAGERRFDSFVEETLSESLVINDLLLSNGQTHFQFDAVVIMNGQVNIYEVKNYTGEYTEVHGSFVSSGGFLMQDPIGQVERKKSYLHNLLLRNGYSYEINSYVVFIHPDFYIYEHRQNEKILFYGQLARHLNIVIRGSRRISAQDKRFANFLVKHHNGKYRPDNLPAYTFSELKKGVRCAECHSFHFSDTRQTRTCSDCGHKEIIADAIYRSVIEFQLLFPETPITVQRIYDWCGGEYSQYWIRSALNERFSIIVNGPKTFYH